MMASALALAACQGGGNENAEEAEGTSMDGSDIVGSSGDRSEVVWCAPISQRVTAADCEDVKALEAQVQQGAAALNVPNPVFRGVDFEVTLVLDRRSLATIERIDEADAAPPSYETSGEAVASATDAAAPVTDAGASATDMAEDAASDGSSDGNEPLTPRQAVRQLPGEDHEFTAQVGRFMRASLTGQGFKTTLLSPEDGVLEIPEDGQGRWTWEVTATEKGDHVLTAKLDALARVGGRDIPLGDGHVAQQVRVKVRVIDSIRDFLVALPGWIKLLTLALLAAAGLMGAWWRLRRSATGQGG